ncbi:MAG: hypothetical protein ACYS8Z_04970, partial [Planctomycetota bacterium]
SSNVMNCGKCEKCVRTMTALKALGKLSKCRAFPANDVSKKLLSSVSVDRPYQRSCYEQLIEPLQAQGREDLARVIKKLIIRYQMKRVLRGIDKRLCGGRLIALKKTIFNKTKTQPATTQ